MNGKAGLKILVVLALFVLALLFAAQPWLSVYLVEEALTVLLSIALLLALILISAMALLLLWHGARFLFLMPKRIVGRIASLRGRPVRVMSHPISGHGNAKRRDGGLVSASVKGLGPATSNETRSLSPDRAPFRQISGGPGANPFFR